MSAAVAKAPDPEAWAEVEARNLERRRLAEALRQRDERIAHLEAQHRQRDQRLNELADQIAELQVFLAKYTRQRDAEMRDLIIGQRRARKSPTWRDGRRLLKWLEEEGNSKRAAGNKIVSRIRKGKQRRVGDRVARELAEAFDIDPDRLPEPDELPPVDEETAT